MSAKFAHLPRPDFGSAFPFVVRVDRMLHFVAIDRMPEAAEPGGYGRTTKTLCRVGCHRNNIASPADLADLIDRFCPRGADLHERTR